jgi:hypothetical protein
MDLMRASVLLLLRDGQAGESKPAGSWQRFEDDAESGEEKAERFGREWAAQDPARRSYKVEVESPEP